MSLELLNKRCSVVIANKIIMNLCLSKQLQILEHTLD